MQKKREELRQLQSLEKKELSDKQKLPMYELRDELMAETKEVLNRKLLLRPNTSFAVYWKLFFATCLIWELAHAAAKPWLFNPYEKKSKTNSNIALTVKELAAQKLVPVHVSELPQCREPKQKSLTLPWLFISNKTEHIVRP